MKAILEFNLPEDKFEYETAVQSVAMWGVLYDLQTELRAMYKYGDYTDEQNQIIEKIRDGLRESLNEYNVKLND
jgi:hypothetical protein